ncbi:T9SS type A sorting domain-containing protein [Neolewinella agarilytica]|uniref:Por secretion system C-terminal sorting domain-containing protein n=1 Tax=Neolewinella agarilytica TaxID=478744 RepID=A0A1H9HV32_9BACT|nr:T9SS type A sorting domain-containing protein [Neolewinella agarilytica]SEQ66115.1 Por secretion system C-terminal sorting domain-containing protein [Neolewinella agarilytica]
MKKLLLICSLAFFSMALAAQPLFVDEFDDGTVTPDTDKFDISELNGEMIVAGNGTNGAWDGVWYQLPQNFDLTASPKLYVRAKTSVLGTSLRMDLADGTNFTSVAPITQTLTDEYRVLEYDFSTVDVGEIDLTSITAIFFFIDGGVGGFTGQVAFDYFALGEEPEGTIMSDIYQDHMDTDSSLTSFTNDVPGYTRIRTEDDNGDSTVVTIVGDGTAGPWTPHVYALRPAPEFIQTSIDITDNPKFYIKARTSVPGTSFRIDAQDNDNIASIGLAVTRILTEEWAVYEYDMTGAFQNFENDACPDAMANPCDVDLEAIKEMLIFINGGTGQFAGTIDIDWISFGVNLDGEGPQALLMYQDEFSNDQLTFTGEAPGVAVSEVDGALTLTGDGSSGQFAAVTYNFHEATDDQDTAYVERTVDFSAEAGQGKVFIRARTNGEAHPMRIDLVDSSGLATNLVGLTKRITSEWSVITYDFTGNYGDAGYGGAEGCTPEDPCLIDETQVSSLFFYVRPGEGLFDGQIEIDWVSVGQPLEEQMETAVGVVNYSDTLVGAGEFFSGAPGGITYNVSEEGFFTMTGDGSSPTYQQIRYQLRDDAGNANKADAAGSGDKLYIRARIRNADSAPLRIDLADEAGFESTNAGAANVITGAEFATYEYDYAGRYEDGGYGGTSCAEAAAPCDVDAQRVTEIVFYPAPDNGAFSGDIDINWISFGQEISVNVSNFAELDKLMVFPNPATDELGVEYNLPASSQVSVSLFDGLGRRVLVRDFGLRAAGNNFNRLNVQELPTGTYHLQVTVNGQPVRAQTILKR